MPPSIALLDANVLYPAELRSFLMYLAVPEIYCAKWSNDIHQEWMSSLLLNRPDLTREQLERSKRAVLAVVMGWCQSYVSTQRYVDT